MKKCVNCGNQLDDNVKFCMVCGAKQPGADRQMENDNGGEKKSYKTFMIVGIAMLVAAIVIFASVLLAIYYKKNKEIDDNDDDQTLFTEEEYKKALDAYSEYIESYRDSYNNNEFAADIILDSIGNPVLVTYGYTEKDEDDTELNVLWYDGEEVECIYEFTGDEEFESLRLCTDGIFCYPDYETGTLGYYQISGGEVNKILTQSEDSEAVIYYEGKQYNLDFMDADTYCDENEELLEKFYISIYDEEIVNNALKNYSAFDLMSTGGVENLSNMGSILSPYYSYSDNYQDVFEINQIEALIVELKDNYINTQKEFYIYKENFIDGNIYDDSQRKSFGADVIYDNAIVMRDVNWFYEMNIMDFCFENSPNMYYEYLFIESIRFPADAFGYGSWNELICLSNQNDEDADNAAYIYEYMESYVGIIKIQDLIDKYGSDWKSIIEEYTDWVYSDEFADKVSDTGNRLKNGEDIFADFDDDAADSDTTEESTTEEFETESEEEKTYYAMLYEILSNAITYSSDYIVNEDEDYGYAFYEYYAIDDFDSDGKKELMIYKECGWDINIDNNDIEDELTFYKYNNGSVEETNLLWGAFPDIESMIFYSNGIVEFPSQDYYFCINGNLLEIIGITEKYDLYGSDLSYWGKEYLLTIGEYSDNTFENDYIVGIADGSGATVVKSITLEEYNEYLDILHSGNIIDVEINKFNYQELEEVIETETAEESDVKSGISENSELDEYILPDSNSRYLQKSDLEGLTAYELRLARNELFARHGRLFDDKELQAYFDSKSWYNGTISPDDFDDDVFNKYEIANRDLIVEYEQEQGYR